MFRVSGSARVVADLKLAIDEGHTVNLQGLAVADVATLLKRFLGEIPGKLIPFFNDIKHHVGAPDLHERITQLATPEHCAFLKFVFAFIARVAAHSETNKMTPANCAMVFSPVMIDLPDLNDFALASTCIERCIAEGEALFNV